MNHKKQIKITLHPTDPNYVKIEIDGQSHMYWPKELAEEYERVWS